eukprot:432715_1
MAFKFDFEQLKHVQKSIEFAVCGYIRECQQLLPSNNAYYTISQLIEFTILFYYNDYDCFDVNDSKIFNFDYAKQGNYYHIFSKTKIKRQHRNEYQWIIKTNKYFKGRFGVMNDTKNILDSITNGKCYWKNVAITNIGSVSGGHSGTLWGKPCKDLSNFIAENGDIITIHLDYVNDTISFKSKTRNKEISKPLINNTECLRFAAECCWQSSTIELV